MGDEGLSTRDLAGRSEPEPAAAEESSLDDEDEGNERLSADAAKAESNEPLLPDDQSEDFTKRWQEIQTGFVDEPRNSVSQADALVADLMKQLAAGFAEERERLEAQWDRGSDVSTEDLRIALQQAGLASAY